MEERIYIQEVKNIALKMVRERLWEDERAEWEFQKWENREENQILSV